MYRKDDLSQTGKIETKLFYQQTRHINFLWWGFQAFMDEAPFVDSHSHYIYRKASLNK